MSHRHVAGLELSVDLHTVAGGGDLNLGVGVVDDRPRRAADEGGRAEGSETDRGDEPRPVSVHRGIELFLRFTALVVVEDERVVGVARVHGGDAAADEGEHSGAGHVAASRDLLLRRDGRFRGEGDRRRLQASSGEDLPAQIVGPLILRIRPRGEPELEERSVGSESEHDVAHRQRSALGAFDDLRERGDEARAGVLAFGARADREPIRHPSIAPVVGREAERRTEIAGGLGHVARCVQNADRHVAEGLHTDGDLRPRNASTGAEGLLFVRVAALSESDIQEVELRVASLLAEFGVESVHGGVELGERRVEELHDAGVVARAERVRRRVSVGGEALDGLGVLERTLGVARPALHDDGQHRVFRLPVERGDVDEVFVGHGRSGNGGFGREGRGEGEEKEHADHGRRPPDGVKVILKSLEGRANRSRKLRKSQKNGRIFANCFLSLYLWSSPRRRDPECSEFYGSPPTRGWRCVRRG